MTLRASAQARPENMAARVALARGVKIFAFRRLWGPLGANAGPREGPKDVPRRLRGAPARPPPAAKRVTTGQSSKQPTRPSRKPQYGSKSALSKPRAGPLQGPL
eukprot:6108051-Pyramimonas_sp.AAC.1